MSLKIEHLDKMDIKIGDQIQILNEIKTLKKKKKVIPVKSPSCESSTPSPVKPAVTPQPASDPPFLLISSSGPSADYWSNMFGLYRKTEEMSEGHSVYTQMHDDTDTDTQYGSIPRKLFSAKGVWSIAIEENGLLDSI